MFKINPQVFEMRPLEEAHTSEGHFYKHIENGKTYVSITTIFKILEPGNRKPWYKRWVDSVMYKQNLEWDDAVKWCEEYSKRSMDVGTKMHKFAEDYAQFGAVWCNENLSEFEQDPYELFLVLKKWLDENVMEINATECKLYSDELEVAGTVDLVATLKTGEKVIIDFKNSRNKKTPSKIRDSHYYEQMCAYAKMWEFCTGEKLNTGIVLVVSWPKDEKPPQVRPFECNLEDHENALWSWIIRYDEYKCLNSMN